MIPVRKSVAAAAMVGALLVGGAAGAILFGPSVAGAQSTPTTVPAPSTDHNGASIRSNEDPAHEAAETAEQEAAEDSGRFHHGRHGSKEDPAHEATESPEREAETGSTWQDRPTAPNHAAGPAFDLRLNPEEPHEIGEGTRVDRLGRRLRAHPARPVPGGDPIDVTRAAMGQPEHTTTCGGRVLQLPQQPNPRVLVREGGTAVVVDHQPRRRR